MQVLLAGASGTMGENGVKQKDIGWNENKKKKLRFFDKNLINQRNASKAILRVCIKLN